MKVIRYEDSSGKIHYAAEQQGGKHLRVDGDPLNAFEVMREAAIVGKILAPVDPPMIWCVGKNYRRHADEVGMGIDEYPEVFAKGINSVQHPGQPAECASEVLRALVGPHDRRDIRLPQALRDELEQIVVACGIVP